ncbi:MAG: methyltransferase domain-containing protein, partial [Alphaproteobacteria bacterium]
ACLCFVAFIAFRTKTPAPAASHPPKKINHWLLLLISLATLYIELVIIRWLGTEVRIFAYVQNIVLITCFLGFGVGCFTSDKPGSLMPSLYKLAILAVIISMPSIYWQAGLLNLSELLTLNSDAVLWGDANMYYLLPVFTMKVAAVVLVACMLWLIATTMVPLGQWVGYCFDHSKNVVSAYTVNLAGSLAGSWLLLLLAFLHMPPAYWLTLAFALVLLATPKYRPHWVKGFVLLALILVTMQGSIWKNVHWSPYQKLSVFQLGNDEYLVNVNNSGYMTMANTTPAYLAKAAPDVVKAYKDSVYNSPFRFFPDHPSVLVVGAGAGNDAAAALRNGASHVDAVEIDPVIYQLGRKLHPEHPYDSARVNVIINDARNFFRTTDRKYDAVIFGLLDSHTKVSGYTNMRVDNYVYTKEAFEQAKKLLKPEGVMAVKFEVREPWTWVGQRFYRTLTEVFGKAPVTYYVKGGGNMWSGAIFLLSDGKQLAKRTAEKDAVSYIAEHKPPFKPTLAGAPEPPTDDWPYVYNLKRSIPQTYLTVALILVALAWFMVKDAITFTEKQTWPMFALGAGFMLMETQMISRLTLYFGMTWVVNSIAISAILCVLVLSNFYVLKRKNVDSPVYPAVLIVALVANYLFPWEQLPYAPWVVGSLLGCAYAVAVFMAGVIFVSTLRKAKKTSAALGSNVMGSVVGGLAQNLSFIFGVKALLLLAAAFYAAYVYAVRRKEA